MSKIKNKEITKKIKKLDLKFQKEKKFKPFNKVEKWLKNQQKASELENLNLLSEVASQQKYLKL